MSDFTSSEPQIRFLAFSVIFLTLAIIELLAPRLEREEMRGALKSRRWITNLSMVVISSLALRVIFPLAAVGTATWAASHGYGLFPMLGISPIISGVVAFIVLDFAVWFEHVMSHRIELLWRIHRMHHADTGFDLTTALRFHPIEIILSMFWKAAVIVVLGPPVVAVLIFEIILNGAAMFNHANIKLPLKLDNMIRKLIVTPDMHRVHHSTLSAETNSNYGFNLSIWDRLFGTYIAQPKSGHDTVKIGLETWRDKKPSTLLWALKVPFLKR
jgi:sterol desaturase/sphingolipid hydroxylase (fatty acid hydroxylase superfamily)